MSGADRRALIEEAASRLFAMRGYAGTSIAAIAAAAGITKPVVYLHFPSKRQLHLELLLAHRDELLAQLAAGESERLSFDERFRRIAERWFEYVRTHPYEWRMLFRDASADREIASFHRDMQAAARAALAGLIREDPELDVGRGESELLAEVLRAALTGLADWSLDHPAVPRSRLIAALITGVWDGLASRLDSAQALAP
jgi:AcrR family transcriptional regulator